MYPLYKYFGQYQQSGDVGIEIEAEFKIGGRLPELERLPTGWSWKHDGSLRNEGREFCGKKPFTMAELPRRVDAICKYITNPEYDLLSDNNRCGVHVHVNVQDFSLLQYYTAVTAYWLLENLMLKYCGEDEREGNAYCLRIADAESVLNDVIEDLKNTKPLFNCNGLSRYASQNLSCSRRYGSIEYRGMRGTYDPKTIIEWATALWTLSRKSNEMSKNPEHFLNWYETTDENTVLTSLFPESFVEKLKAIPNYNELMKENLYRVDSLAYVHDWDKWARRMETACNPDINLTLRLLTVPQPQINYYVDEF